ncbi:MAG: DinB family protein [Promethearchaeota archaeon]
MSEEAKRVITLDREDGLSPRVALLYSMMEKVRGRLFSRIESLSDVDIDYSPHGRSIETIGTLLFHIAAVEWSWIFEDIGGKEMDYEKWKQAFPLREDIDQLTGQRVEFYFDRLNEVRQEVLEWLRGIDDEELDRLIDLGHAEVSIEWVLFHLIEHEAMHIGQISVLSRMYDMTRVQATD